METITLTLEVPSNQLDVHKAAHKAIIKTMADGFAINNGVDTWRHKHPVDYHLRKAMLHTLDAHHAKDVEALETTPPHMSHVRNAITRLAMALATNSERDFQALEVGND